MLFDKLIKKPEDTPSPTLLGEDFDIYPDLSDGSKKKEQSQEGSLAPEEPTAAEPEPEPEPTAFQKRVAAISDKNWKRIQIISGSILGIISGYCISFLSETETFSNYGLIIAAVLALILPNFVEKRADRKMVAMRISIIISLVVFMVFYLLCRNAFQPAA